MPHVTAKVLREQLRQMMADDLVVRHPLTPARLGVRYRVTRHGRSLQPVFATLWQWGRAHLRAVRRSGRHSRLQPRRIPDVTRRQLA
jgi:DNA-binding HxlR family transcriptional regulator